MRIAAYRGKGFISRLIQAQTRSQYSHIAILDDDDGGSVYESWANGGVLHNATLSSRHSKGTKIDLFEFVTPLNYLQKLEMRAWMRNQLGKKYDFRSVLRFVTRINKKGAENKWFCSEYAFLACFQIKIELLCRIEPFKIPPSFIPLSPLLKFSETVVTV